MVDSFYASEKVSTEPGRLHPVVERVLRDAKLAGDFGHRRAGLGLPQGMRDLLVAVAGLFQGEPPVDWGADSPRISRYP
jgi:hypothetical protein